MTEKERMGHQQKGSNITPKETVNDTPKETIKCHTERNSECQKRDDQTSYRKKQ
jgi:hypothetical protein